MVFMAPLRERIRSGEITCSVRMWQSARVKVGGLYTLAPGAVRVTKIDEIGLDDVTPSLARRSGFAGVVELLKVAKHGAGRRLFLVEFQYVAPGTRRSRAKG